MQKYIRRLLLKKLENVSNLLLSEGLTTTEIEDIIKLLNKGVHNEPQGKTYKANNHRNNVKDRGIFDCWSDF